MITVSDVSLSFGGQMLFKDVNLLFTAGNCYGVIGANGAGKSTFLKILCGALEPTTGTVTVQEGLRMSVLKQDHYAYDEYTVQETVIMGNPRLYEVMKQKDALYAKEDFTEEDGNLASELEGEFAELGGWEAESDASKLVQGLGLDESIMYAQMSSLAGNEKVKVLLAQALFGNPDIILMDEPTNHLDIDAVAWLEDFLAEGGVEFIAPELWERYYETVLGERLATVPADNLNLLYTPLCGTGNKPVRTVLGRIGVNVAVVPAQEKPDGDFKTCEYPNPETDAALNESYKIARETHPDLILGTDPDCDRVAVAVPVEGSFRKLSGNELGCLLLDYILGTMQKAGTLPADPVAVRSIVSTPMADKIAASYGVKMRRVLTGFKYIGGEILALEQKHEENRFVFGFEESCGYLKGTYARDKDAVVASMLTCDLAAALKREGTNLAEHMDALYSRFGWHEARVLSCELQGPDAMEISAGFMAQMRRELPKAVCGIAVTSVTDYQARVTRDLIHGTEEAVTLPKSNVLVLQLGEKGTVILRPSGTEPKVKIYLTAVDADRAAAMKLLDDMAAEMSGYLPKNA